MRYGFAGTCFLDSFISKLSLNDEWRVIRKLDDVNDADVVIFTGGSDIDPSFYNEKNYYSASFIERDKFEFEVLKDAINLGKKIIGVCRGHQLINVALGGTLYQDIHNDLKINHHPGILDWKNKPPILQDLFINVNSMHHQAVRSIGEGLIPIAYAKDGIIESMMCPKKKILTFQFHPECLLETRDFFHRLQESTKLF